MQSAGPVVSLLDVTTSGLRPERPARRRLTDLLRTFPAITAASPPEAEVSGVVLDSRAVQPGDLYAALPGARTHGASFAAQVVAAGAAAILTDPEGARRVADALPGADVPVLTVEDPRSSLGAVSSWVYGDPTAALRLLGVTGTNGKTTVAYLIDAGLRGAGQTTGLVGTVETRVAGRAVPSTRTTPEAPDLQGLFAAMVEQGVESAAMEVSSHALALHRVDGCRFAAAAFTNLSQDHLDFHSDMDAYFEAKAMLFAPERSAVAVIDIDDPAGRRLLERRPDAVPVSSIAQAGRRTGGQPPAAWWAEDVVTEPSGSRFRLHGPGGRAQDVTVPLPGAFNVANTVVALTLLAETGVPLDAAAAGIAALPGVPGRMEKVDIGQPYLAVVDYAHTPAAVTTLLATLRSVVPGRLILVLGCGGDRDRAKRPLMGAAAVRGADVAVLTSDNPRSEDPQAILDAMLRGVDEVPAEQRGIVVVEPDRTAAIRIAVAHAGPGDVVVVAGKGHETGQVAGETVTPFDDRVVLRASLGASSGSGRSGVGETPCSR
jgi:UDP-N-acetylmuramoyl-L-alanyl-D-glutamate--2,6-diaminopimelate ligase